MKENGPTSYQFKLTSLDVANVNAVIAVHILFATSSLTLVLTVPYRLFAVHTYSPSSSTVTDSKVNKPSLAWTRNEFLMFQRKFDSLSPDEAHLKRTFSPAYALNFFGKTEIDSLLFGAKTQLKKLFHLKKN